jgi:hypothetical protein
LGHWLEVNDEIMATLSKYEPPMDVEEKDSTFLFLERNLNHLVLNSQSRQKIIKLFLFFNIQIFSFIVVYLQKRALLIKHEFDQNNQYK